MKIKANSEFRIPNSECAMRPSERGMATLIFIALLAIMLVLVMAESTALFHLHREMQLLERHQIQRLDAAQTNTIAATKQESK